MFKQLFLFILFSFFENKTAVKTTVWFPFCVNKFQGGFTSLGA